MSTQEPGTTPDRPTPEEPMPGEPGTMPEEEPGAAPSPPAMPEDPETEPSESPPRADRRREPATVRAKGLADCFSGLSRLERAMYRRRSRCPRSART